MRFSLYLNPQTSGPQDDHDIIEACAEGARAADQAGFAGVCLTHHHFSDYNTYSDPFMFGSYLAGQMKQAWILLTVAVAPLLNPLNLVERANLLDQLLSGKLVIGIGSGGSPLEFEGLGRDPEQRSKISAEVMEVAMRAWEHKPGDAPLAYQTTHDSGTMRGRIMPSSFRRPRPILARAGLNETAWREAGEKGMPLLFGRVGAEGAKQVMSTYLAALESAGHDAATVRICRDWTVMQKTVLLGATDDEALAAIDAPLGTLQRLSAAAFGAANDKQRQQVTGIAGNDPAAFKKAFVEGATIVGSPATFIDRLHEYEDAGVEHIALHMSFGYLERRVARRTFDLFVDKVMPRFSVSAASRTPNKAFA